MRTGSRKKLVFALRSRVARSILISVVTADLSYISLLVVLQLKEEMRRGINVNKDLFALGCSPDYRVTRYTACIVNGVRFSTTSRDANKKTQNSGIMLPGAGNPTNNDHSDYFGTLKEIICLQYHDNRSVVIFKGDWFMQGKDRIKNDGYFKSINVGKLAKTDDDYILATQAKKVFYLTDRDPANKGWKIVQTYDHRHLYNVSENEGVRYDADAYQEQEQAGRQQGHDTYAVGTEQVVPTANLRTEPLRRILAVVIDLMNKTASPVDNDNGDEVDDTCDNYVDEHDPFPDIDSDEE